MNIWGFYVVGQFYFISTQRPRQHKVEWKSHFGIAGDSSGTQILKVLAALKVVAHHYIVFLPWDATAGFLWGGWQSVYPEAPRHW